jgi:tRNA threonylcarbamoyladenosine dehydratase
MTLAAEQVQSYEIPTLPRQDQFLQLQYTEADCPLLAEAAWRLHAQGYQAKGFVTRAAINERGWLPEDIDKSRGPNIRYTLAMDAEGNYPATLREFVPGPGETYKDLPAYRLCERGLSPMGLELLQQQADRGSTIKEIGAMAGTNPRAVFEVIRNTIQNSIGKGETLFFSIVSTTYESLERNFGTGNLITIGEDMRIDDTRVNQDIRLRPAVLFPDTFNDNLLTAYERAQSTQERAVLERSLLFYTDGLEPSRMSDRVYRARQGLLMQQQLEEEELMSTHSVVSEVTSNRVGELLAFHTEPPEYWTEPLEFDLSQAIDEAELLARFEADGINSVVDSVDRVANELFEVRHPDRINDLDFREQFVAGIKAMGTRFGKWFLFPWSQKLVRYPDVGVHRDLRTARNKNLITSEEQDRLYDASILVGGLSVGSSIVEELVASGIGGTLIIGDPDTISPSNLGRIRGGFQDVGRGKIDHAAIKISEADPYIEQVHLRDGITEESLESLAVHPAIIFDAVDDLRAKVLLRRYAQRNGIPLVMVTDAGKRSIVDIERYDQGTAQPFGGRLSERLLARLLDGTASAKEVRKAMVGIVGLRNVSPRMLDSFVEVGRTLPGVAQLGRTATKGGSLAANVAEEIILEREMPTGRYIDSARKTLGLKRDASLVALLRTLGRLVKPKK